MEKREYRNLLMQAIAYHSDAANCEHPDDAIPPSENDIVLGPDVYRANQRLPIDASLAFDDEIFERLGLKLSDSPEVLFYKVMKLELSDIEKKYFELEHQRHPDGAYRHIFTAWMSRVFSDFNEKRHERNPPHLKPITKQLAAEELMKEMEKILG